MQEKDCNTDIPASAIERLKKISGNGAKAVLNCVYGNRAWEDTLTELQDTLESQGFRCVAAFATVAEHSILRQFATGRPDEQDKAELIEMAGKIQKRLSKDFTDPLSPYVHFFSIHTHNRHMRYPQPKNKAICTQRGTVVAYASSFKIFSNPGMSA